MNVKSLPAAIAIDSELVYVDALDHKSWPTREKMLAAIVAGLNEMYRYNGWTQFVADGDAGVTVLGHSFNVATAMPEYAWRDNASGNPAAILRALTHDFAEAFIGDIPHPVKAVIPEISDIEGRILEQMAEFFEWPRIGPDVWTDIHEADKMRAHYGPSYYHCSPDSFFRLYGSLAEKCRAWVPHWARPRLTRVAPTAPTA